MGKSSKNLQYPSSRCQQKVQAYHSALQHMWFCRENQIDQREMTGTIISAEHDNEMKYREEIGNAYNDLKHWKRNLFDLTSWEPGKTFNNEWQNL